MARWALVAGLLILAVPAAAALPRLNGQSGNEHVSKAHAQQRLLQQSEAIHFQVVCGKTRLELSYTSWQISSRLLHDADVPGCCAQGRVAHVCSLVVRPRTSKCTS